MMVRLAIDGEGLVRIEDLSTTMDDSLTLKDISLVMRNQQGYVA